MTVGIVTAKRQSRRLPDKNVRELCGLPMFLWSVRQIVCSQRIDMCLVSTDDEEMAEMARAEGAEVRMRETPEELDPEASGTVPLIAAVQSLGLDDDDLFVHSLPTSPLRWPWDWDRIIKSLELGADYVLPVAPMVETIVYDLTHGKVTVPILASKGKRFAIQALGGTAWRARLFHHTQEYVAEQHGGDLRDSETDKQMTGLLPDPTYWFPREGRHERYYVKEWQQFEIDDEDGWAICEALMERQILGPLGHDCYQRYKRGELC